MNTTEHARRSPAVTTGLFAPLRGLLRGGGSGARSKSGGRTPSLRLAVLAVVAATALLSLTASPASALTTRQFKSEITEAAGAPFGEVAGLAVDSSDRLWLADYGRHAVDRFSSTGTYEAQNSGTGSWGESQYVRSLAFSQAANLGGGEVFAADSNHDDLWGLDPATAAYSGKDLRPLGASECCFIQVAADNSASEGEGDLYVSSGSAVRRIDAETGAADDFSATASNELTGPFTSAEGLAVAPNGDFYVGGTNASFEPAVFEFKPSGELIREITEAEPGEALAALKGLAVDPTNEHLLITTTARKVSEFDSSGGFLREILKPGGAPFHGFIGTPSLAVSSTGLLYVSDPSLDSNPAVVDVFGPLITLPDITTLPAEVHSTTEATLKGEVDPAEHPVTECFEPVQV